MYSHKHSSISSNGSFILFLHLFFTIFMTLSTRSTSAFECGKDKILNAKFTISENGFSLDASL
jgi:hypothetical protein